MQADSGELESGRDQTQEVNEAPDADVSAAVAPDEGEQAPPDAPAGDAMSGNFTALLEKDNLTPDEYEQLEAEALEARSESLEPEPEPEPEPETEAEAAALEAEPAKGKQNRLRAKSELDQLAMDVYRANEKFDAFTMEDALAQAKKQLGLSTDSETPEAESETTEPDIPEDAPQSIADLKEENNQLLDTLGTLTTELATAQDELDYDLQSEIKDRIDGVRERLRLLQEAEPAIEQAESAKAEQFETAWNAEVQEIQKLYPDLKNEESAFTKRLEEVRQLQPQRVDSPEALRRVCDLIADEMGVLPGQRIIRPPAPTKSAKNAAPTPQRRTQAAPPVAPASGANRSSAPAVPALVDRLDKVTTPQDLEALEEELGLNAI